MVTQNVDYPIVGNYNNQKVSEIDGERSVNCFEYIDLRGKKPKLLIGTSGLLNSGLTFSNQQDGFRAEFVFNVGATNILFQVIGNNVFLTNAGLGVSLIGIINTFTGYVGITANTYQVIIVDGLNGWIWDTQQNIFEQITDTSFPAHPVDVTYLDGFFVVANGDTNSFQLSAFNQGLSWGGASLTFTADFITSLLTISSTANFQTGISVTLSNMGGALPSGLLSSNTYFVIQVSATTIKLASSYENAITGVFVTFADNGSGTNTITNTGIVQQGSITSHPGTIVACRTLHRRLFLFSQNFTEVWENAGLGSTLPFRRNNNALIELGTPSVWSIVTGFDLMFFLSQDKDGLGPVQQVIGTQALSVSTRALDKALATYASNPSQGVNDAVGILIKENGLIFYRLNFTQANHTYVYNVSMSDPSTGNDADKRWHEEEDLNGNRHPAQTHSYFNGVNYYGHYAKPIMYIVNSNYYTNDGEAIHRYRIGGPVSTPPNYVRTRLDRHTFDMLQGTIDQITDPYVDGNINSFPILYFSYSKDGGQTYGSVLPLQMGSIGQNTFRTVVRKLGVIPRGQTYVPKIEFWDPIPFIVLGSSLALEYLPE